MNFLGIDIGTTSVKTAAFNDTLEQQISLTADYTLDAHGDIVEFDGEQYWHIVKGVAENRVRTPMNVVVEKQGVHTVDKTVLQGNDQ